MSMLEYFNFGATVLTFGTVSFAASNFGVKLGKASGFKNNTGYKYISEASPEKIDKLYEETVKVAKKDEKAPKWAKNLADLKKWCKSYQTSLRKWSDSSKYCLIQNTVRHKLIELEDDFKFKNSEETAQASGTAGTEEKCTDDLLNSYADGKESLYYMAGKKYCKADSQPSAAAAA